jgi:diguanylate cyclase (GGDEF)-like protein
MQRAELRRASQQAAALARIDALTGLGNRRAFDETLERELSAARRYATPLSVLVADLDGFKAVNDRHGHPAGDEALRQVADALVETVRRPDACFRWGGDEFAVLLPRTGPERAELVANRVRAAIARDVRVPGGDGMGISVGVAELRPDQAPDELLAAADQALLAAKAAREQPRTAGWRFGRTQARGGSRR